MTDPLPRLPPRPADAHKGTVGRVLVVAGSSGMSGAAVLCATAALRSGAGLVTVATAAPAQPMVAIGQPCAMTLGLAADAAGRVTADAADVVMEAAGSADVVAVGPGLGRAPGVTAVVTELVARCRRPMVLDADGLNALAGRPELLRQRPGPTVITPHAGEFARLGGDDPLRFAADHGVVVVLKGPGSRITDGSRSAVNPTGNPGLATGGTGDVLTGVIAALIGQRMSPFDAARLGAWLHGRAGDLARDRLGEISLIATDLLDTLPAAFREATG